MSLSGSGVGLGDVVSVGAGSVGVDSVGAGSVGVDSVGVDSVGAGSVGAGSDDELSSVAPDTSSDSEAGSPHETNAKNTTSNTTINILLLTFTIRTPCI
jgi:hypothetical protein